MRCSETTADSASTPIARKRRNEKTARANNGIGHSVAEILSPLHSRNGDSGHRYLCAEELKHDEPEHSVEVADTTGENEQVPDHVTIAAVEGEEDDS